VATPLATCETRDRKGLYARARAGLIKQFTGVSDPYETPVNPEIVVDTSLQTAGEAADKILAYLAAQGYLGRGSTMEAAPHKVMHEPITLWTSDTGGLPQTLSPGDAAPPPAGKRLHK
jgi:sulfate adenylyltransferase